MNFYLHWYEGVITHLNQCHCQMALNLLHPKSHHHCTSDWGQEELLGSPGLIAKLGISDIKRPRLVVLDYVGEAFITRHSSYHRNLTK
jgi:hypothetical protein